MPSALSPFKGLVRRLRSYAPGNRDRFLRQVSGVVHVGANLGQEAALYDAFGLWVVWIEPIPHIFKRLTANIAPYPRQLAIEALVTDVADKTYTFNVANNDGQSSSILDLGLHTDIWPTVRYEQSLQLRSTTLPNLLASHHVELGRDSALVMDTQGSELLVLRGTESILRQFKFVKTEVADFESYTGCCQLADLNAFLASHGFAEYSRRAFATHPQGGRYYDIVYRRQD